MLRSLLRATLYTCCYLLAKLFISVEVEGRENIPPKGPLIIISNHFSIFEPPLTVINLPYIPIYMAAVEHQSHWVMRLIMKAFELIPVWRGQVDREAIRRALQLLAAGGILGLMPEGGVLPELMDSINTGQQVSDVPFAETGRMSAQLIEARPGTAYIAARSQAPILPIAFLGTEQIAVNMTRWRRTKVKMIIGRSFGPLSLDENLRGAARRDCLNALGETMMQELAALLPPENRGPYA